jgi:hypothetical protein
MGTTLAAPSRRIGYMLGHRHAPTQAFEPLNTKIYDTVVEADEERAQWHGIDTIVRVTIEDVVGPCAQPSIEYQQLADALAVKLLHNGVDRHLMLEWLRQGPEAFYSQAGAVFYEFRAFQTYKGYVPDVAGWGDLQAALWYQLSDHVRHLEVHGTHGYPWSRRGLL